MATPTIYTPKRLALPQQLPGAAGILYTAPAANPAKVSSIKLVNTTAAPVLVSLYIVENAGAVADNRALCKDFSVPADGLPHEILEGGNAEFNLEALDTIRGVAGAVASITVHLSGVEYV